MTAQQVFVWPSGGRFAVRAFDSTGSAYVVARAFDAFDAAEGAFHIIREAAVRAAPSPEL